jgi:uncharacterized protein (DUF342 family)
VSLTDPRLDLFTCRGQVFVTVHHHAAGGPPVDLTEAQALLAEWPLATRDTRTLAHAIRGAEGRPVVFATLEPAADPGHDDPYAVVVSPTDGRPFLVPWATAEPPPPTAETIERALRLAGLGASAGVAIEISAQPWQAPIPLAPAPERRGRAGRFDLDWHAGEILLSVTPPADSGLAVRRDDVCVILEAVPGVVTDEDGLTRALARPSGEFVTVARLEPTARPESGEVAVCVTEDGLAAYLVPWSRDPSQPLALAEAEAVLAAAGVVHGIDPARLADLAQGPFRGPRLVARGTPPEHGWDATIQWLDPGHTGAVGLHAPQVLDDGRIDYRDLGEEATVTAGAVLALKAAAVPAGRPGRSVCGQELPARPGRDVALAPHAGPGTEVSTDGTMLRAVTAGLVVRSGPRLSVTAVRTVAGDVDFKTGNVVFDGSVVVRGDVRAGFRVKATGSIQVDGEVSDAVLESDGDVQVTGGIVGQLAVMRAGGALRAGHLRSAEVTAEGPITVKSEVWQCYVVSRENVCVTGRIVGGEVIARTGVVAQTLGAAAGTPTAITVGGAAPPTDEARNQPGFCPAAVVATKTVFPGVSVTVDGFRTVVERKSPPVTFREKGGEVLAIPGARLR